MTASIRITAGLAVIALPDDARAQLLTDLADCPCAAPKSRATAAIRRQFRAALEHPPVEWPLRDIHGLRVALGDCPCRASRDTTTIRHRLSGALAKTGF